MKNTLFPVFLKTESSRFLIIGGGRVGTEKTATLLRQNPAMAITIVSPAITEELRDTAAKYPNVATEQREFCASDLDSADFVIIATNITVLNAKIKALANARGLLVNAADQPGLCDFYLGSIVNKGSLKIAISTNGKSPVLARRLREYFEHAIPDGIEYSIEQLNKLRSNHLGDLSEKLYELNKATAGLSPTSNKSGTRKSRHLVFKMFMFFIVFLIGYGLSAFISAYDF